MNSKKVLIGVIAVVVLIIVLLFLGRQTASRQPDAPLTGVAGSMMVTGSPSYDFGTISMRNGMVSQMFTIKNNGETPVMMKKMYTSCMCTTARMKMMNGQMMGPFGMPGHGAIPALNEALAPGESAEIEVVFDPAAHGPAGVGAVSRSVFIEQENGSPLELMISANVTP